MVLFYAPKWTAVATNGEHTVVISDVLKPTREEAEEVFWKHVEVTCEQCDWDFTGWMLHNVRIVNGN